MWRRRFQLQICRAYESSSLLGLRCNRADSVWPICFSAAPFSLRKTPDTVWTLTLYGDNCERFFRCKIQKLVRQTCTEGASVEDQLHKIIAVFATGSFEGHGKGHITRLGNTKTFTSANCATKSSLLIFPRYETLLYSVHLMHSHCTSQ